MSDTSKPNGNGSTVTVTGAAASVARQALTTLPAQFLVLCAINCIFILGLFWFLSARVNGAEHIMLALVDRCMADQVIRNDQQQNTR